MTGQVGARVTEPIILLGAPRSGTTLLAEILGAHPDVAVAREPRLVWRYGNDAKSDELRSTDANPKVVEHIHRHFREVLREAGRERLVEKTPANSVRPAFVEAVFPDARYVHITRNGWGAVPSMRSFWERRGVGIDSKQRKKMGRRLSEVSPAQIRYYVPELLRRMRGSSRHTPLYGPRLAGVQQIADELGRLETAGRQWQTCVLQAGTFGRALGAQRYMEIQLETLNVERLEAVMSFCRLRPAADVIERFESDFDVAAATRRSELSDEERTLIAPYVGAANAWLGYEDSEAATALDREPTVP